jgi:death on curing protein
VSFIYPTIADVQAIHDIEIGTSGGSHGLRDADLLSSAVMRPRQTFAGVDLYPDLPTKAAALFDSLICNHPFVDGNKRTAVAVAETFLLVNGADLGCSDIEFEQFTLGVARGEYIMEEIAAWFRAHTLPIDNQSEP